MKHWLIIFATTLASTAQGAGITPSSTDTIIATWPVSRSTEIRNAEAAAQSQPNNPSSALLLANTYLAQASLPGEAHLYGLAQSLLKPFIENGTDRADLWMAWAQIQQHQHAFDEALAALNQGFDRGEPNVNAQLLAARIYLIKGDPTAARSACLKLLGHGDLLTTSACTLEAISFQGDLTSSYQQLTELVQRQGLPQDERGPWLMQILADMALRLDDPLTAEKWLQRQNLGSASVNFLGQWADVQLILNQPQNVLDALQPIVEKATTIDDALLLRLALAEKTLEGQRWERQLDARMAQRERRADTQHASELARYYLDINPRPQKALHWAQVNWQNAREHSDRKLLERAIIINKTIDEELVQ